MLTFCLLVLHIIKNCLPKTPQFTINLTGGRTKMAEGMAEGLSNDDPSVEATGSQGATVGGSRMISELPEEKNDDRRPMEREVEISEQTPILAVQPRNVPGAEAVNGHTNHSPNEGAALDLGNQDGRDENNLSESGAKRQQSEQRAVQDKETNPVPRQNDIEDPPTSFMPPGLVTGPSSSMQNQAQKLSKVKSAPKCKQRLNERDLQILGAVGGSTEQPAQRRSSAISAGAQPLATGDALPRATSNKGKGDSVNQARTKGSRERSKKKKNTKRKRKANARPQQRQQEVSCPSNNPPPAATVPQHEPNNPPPAATVPQHKPNNPPPAATVPQHELLPTARQITAVQYEPREVAARPSPGNASSHRVETNSSSGGGPTNLTVPLEIQRILVDQNPARNNHQIDLEVRPRPVIECCSERRETPTLYRHGTRQLLCCPIVTISVQTSERVDQPERVRIDLLNHRPMAPWVWFSQQQQRADHNCVGHEADAVEIDLRPGSPQEVHLRSDDEVSCRAF